jgi:hypothetical protein
MRLILTNQSSTVSPQIPSLAAGLARAESDIAALKAAGCQLGVNTGAADAQSDAELVTWPTITAKFRHFADSVLPASSFTAGSESMPCDWFSLNIEVQTNVTGILFGPGTATAIPLNHPNLNRSSPGRPVRQAMQEYAYLTDGVTYDANSGTLLADGADVTWQQFHAAMVKTQRDAYAYLKDGATPRFAGKVVYDWKQGVAPLPFLGSGWWVNPGYEQTPREYYYYPYRTVSGAKATSLSEGVLMDAAETFAYPVPSSSPFSPQLHDERVIERAIKTAEFSTAIAQRGVESFTAHFFHGLPPDDLATADSSISGAAGYYPIGRGTRPPGTPEGPQNEWMYLPSRDDVMEEISKAFRLTMLGSWKSLGARTGLMFPAAMDSVLKGNRHWGFGTPVADFKAMILDQLTEPVSASEASAFGIAEGTVMSPTVVSLWNATDFFLRGMFGSSGPYDTTHVWDGQHPTTGQYFARMTMERRAAGRTNVSPNWESRDFASNQWYIALANILTDDIIERVQATRSALDRAACKGAAKSSTLASLVGG